MRSIPIIKKMKIGKLIKCEGMDLETYRHAEMSCLYGIALLHLDVRKNINSKLCDIYIRSLVLREFVAHENWEISQH